MKKFIAIISVLALWSCEESVPAQQEFPVIETLAVTDIDGTGVTFRAQNWRPGKAQVTSFGFVWGFGDPISEIRRQEIIVGQDLGSGPFEARVNYALWAGVPTSVRAFASYSGKRVYGNRVFFESLGGTKSPWSQVLSKSEGLNTTYAIGSGGASKGIIVNDFGLVYEFDAATMEVTTGPRFPGSPDGNLKIVPVSVGNTHYVASNTSTNLFKYENGNWTLVGNLPSKLSSTAALFHNNRLFFLNHFQSGFYDLSTGQWSTVSSLPTGAIRGYSSVGKDAYAVTTEKKIWKFDGETFTWTQLPIEPRLVSNDFRILALPGKLIVGLSPLTVINTATGDYTFAEEPPVAMTHQFSLAIGGKWYFGTGNTQATTFWEFDPSKIR
jgi:hypothetical protein